MDFTHARRLCATLPGLLLAGCATLAPPGRSEQAGTSAYDSRAEAVFMYQSRVASRVLDRNADLEIEGRGDADPTLAAADARMAEICHYLNQAAIGRAEGRDPGWAIKIRVLATTSACAQAAREVELLLDNHGDSLATAKL